jgi:hypothetical protein
VNKWMVRFWGVLALVALGALIGTTVWPAVPVTPNPKLAREALHGFFRTSDETYIEKALVEERLRVTKAALLIPEERRAADVLLRRGFNALEVEQLLLRHGLEYMSCEVKTPVSDGSVMTMWALSGGPVPRLPGSISQQVERDIGRFRYQFEERANLSGDAETAAHDREIARSPEIGVYRVEVVGTYRGLAALMDEREVRGVMAELDGQRAQAFDRWLTEQRKNIRVIRTRRVLDPGKLPPH